MLPDMYISWYARSSVLWRCLSKCTSYRDMSDSTELSTCNIYKLAFALSFNSFLVVPNISQLLCKGYVG